MKKIIFFFVFFLAVYVVLAQSDFDMPTEEDGSDVEKSAELLEIENQYNVVVPADTTIGEGQFGGPMLIFSDSNEANKIIGKGIEIGYETQNGFYKLPDDFKGYIDSSGKPVLEGSTKSGQQYCFTPKDDSGNYDDVNTNCVLDTVYADIGGAEEIIGGDGSDQSAIDIIGSSSPDFAQHINPPMFSGHSSLDLNNVQIVASGAESITTDSAVVEGNIEEATVYEDGVSFSNSDLVSFNSGGSASGVTNGIIKDNGNYYFQHVDSLVDKDIAVINGKDVYKVENCFGAGSADTIKKGSSLSSDALDFLNCDNTIEIEQANAVSIDNSMLNHIKNSTFTLDNNKLTDADIMSGKDNNSFVLKDGTSVLADNGEMFNAKFSDDGTIIKTNDSMTISNGFETIITESNPLPDVDYNQSNITLKNIGGNILEIDKELGVVKVQLSQKSRYINYDNTTFSPPQSFYNSELAQFNLYIKKHQDQDITLYLRTTEEERFNILNCSQCGVVDYVDRIIAVNGKVEFERLSTRLPIFTDIILSLSEKNKIVMEMDERMETAEKLWFLGENAKLYSGQFEVLLKDTDVYYRFWEKGTPYAIKQIMPNIEISETGVLKRYEAENIFTMYARDNQPTSVFIDNYDSWLDKTDMAEDYRDSVAPKELWVMSDHVSAMITGPFRYAFLVNVE